MQDTGITGEAARGIDTGDDDQQLEKIANAKKEGAVVDSEIKCELGDAEFVRTDFEHLAESLLQNEDLGDKRVGSFISLGAALFAAIAFLGDKAGTIGVNFHAAVTFVSGLVLAVGALTFLRILRRNKASDGFIEAMNAIRKVRAPGAKESYLQHIHMTSGPRGMFNGGNAFVVAVMNAGLVVVLVWGAYKGQLGAVSLVSAGFFAVFVQFIAATEPKKP
jgi:hypothetical protein